MIPDGAGDAGTVSAKWAKGSGGPAGDECYNLVADTAPTLVSGGNATGGNRFPGTNVDAAVGGGLVVTVSTSGDGYWREGVGTLRGRENDSHENLVAFDCKAGGNTTFAVGDQAGALRANHGGGHAAIAFTSKDYGGDAAVDQTLTLRAMGHAESHPNGGGQIAVAYGVSADALDRSGEGANGSAAERSGLGISEELSPTVKAHGPNAVAQVFKVSHFTRGKDGAPSGVSTPLGAEPDKGDQDPVLMAGTAVRRLTPRECERLQAFPDDHTMVEYRGAPAADGPRYKALGNAMNVKEVGWVLRRIELFEATVAPLLEESR